jgi:peroxin-1
MTLPFQTVGIEPEAKGNALLLTTNTEVSIAPKPHSKKQIRPANSSSNGPNDPASTTAPPKDASIANLTISSQILRVIPPQLLRLSFPEHAGPEVFAYVSPEVLLLLHPAASTDDNVYYKTLMKRLPPPADPSAPPTINSMPPVTRVLKAGNTDASSTNGGEIEEIYVRGVESIPGSHVAFYSVPGIEEWDLVRCFNPLVVIASELYAKKLGYLPHRSMLR